MNKKPLYIALFIGILTLICVGYLSVMKLNYKSWQYNKEKNHKEKRIVKKEKIKHEKNILQYADKKISSEEHWISSEEHWFKKIKSNEPLLKVKEAFSVMNTYRNHLNEMLIIKNILNDLIKIPGSFETISDILVDNQFALNAFGDKQAQARIDSIDLLQALSKDGNSFYLLRTLNGLSKNLATHSPQKGQLADLYELISNYALNHKEFFLKDLPQELQKMGYVKALQKIYKNAIWYSLNDVVNREYLKAIIHKSFPKG